MDDRNCGPPQFDTSERLDELLDALADERRRHTLYFLQEERRADLEEIAVHVASSVRETPESGLPTETVETTKLKLYHVHLPKLDEAGVVEFDPRSETSVYRAPPPPIETFLADCAERERPD